MPSPASRLPPRLAQTLLALSIPHYNREPVLGDFAEEYAHRCQQSTSAAKLWYWKQTLYSLPYLLYDRIKASHIAVQVLLLMSIYLGFLAWMALVFYLFRLVYTTNIFQGSVVLALSARLLLQSSGYVLVGFLTGVGRRKLLPNTSGRSHWPFIAALMIIFIAPSVFEYFRSNSQLMRRYLLAHIIIIGPMIWLGLYSAQRFFGRNNK